MPRNYPQPAAGSRRTRPVLLALAALTGLAALPATGARSADLFAAQPLQDSRFAILARPIGADDWNLLVLEQVAAAPRCWTTRPDGLVDPSLNRFNFTGICNRYIDSNGYSLRIGEQDLASTHRLKLVQVGEELRLQASTTTSPTDLLVGRGRVPLRDRDGFVPLTLEPGWALKRRTYQGRGLSHLYFANDENLTALMARLRPAPPPIEVATPAAPARGDQRTATLLSRRGNLGSTTEQGGGNRFGVLADRGPLLPGRPVPLPVIPFSD